MILFQSASPKAFIMHLRSVALIAALLWFTPNAAWAQVFQLGIEESATLDPSVSNQFVSNVSTEPVQPANRFFHRKHAISSEIIAAGDARAHHDNAVYLADRGKLQEAIAEDELAVGGNPDHPGYQIFLAQLLTEAGQLERALTVYERVCSRFPDVRDDLSECVLELKALLSIGRLEDTIDRVQATAAITTGAKVADTARSAAQTTPTEPKPDRQLSARELADDRPIDDLLY